MPKLIFLIGAPSGRLNWDEDKLLKTSVPPFESETKRVLDQVGSISTSNSSNTSTQVKWRLLSDSKSSLKCIPLEHSVDDTLFLQNGDLMSENQNPSNNATISQFYENSISFHEATCTVSFLESPDVGHTDESGSWEGRSNVSTRGETQIGQSVLFQLPVVGGLSDLANIPNATYLQSIIPQTMSVNLIVGVLNVERPREVVTRTGNSMDLVELMVGDDTRSGFRVTFWLIPDGKIVRRRFPAARTRDEHYTRTTLANLRPRDIVLLRTVGLNSFRNGVYGQSLRNGISKVDLLHREAVDETDTCGLYSLGSLKRAANLKKKGNLDNHQLDKVLRVKEWLAQFMVIGSRGLISGQVPPDSQ